MTALISRFIQDESGTTAIEYGLVGMGISVAILATVQSVGSTYQPYTPQSQQSSPARSNKRYVGFTPAFFACQSKRDFP